MIVSPDTVDAVLKRTAELNIKSELLVDDLQEYASTFSILLFYLFCTVHIVLNNLYYILILNRGIENETKANRIAKMRSAMRSPDGRASPDTYFATYSEVSFFETFQTFSTRSFYF